jgi:CMP-N-acetylneuraminic acid synthetase
LGKLSLLEHSINYAKENYDIIDKIVVSTDDKNIRLIAIESGVEVLDRPAELAKDNASTLSVLKHVLDSMNGEFDNVILLQPTNPLRPKSLLKDAMRQFEKGQFDMLITVSSNYHKFGRIKEGRFVPYNYSMGQRTQDMEPLYFENGLLYIYKAETITKGIALSNNNLPLVVNHPFSNVDIDTIEDLEYAEYIIKQYI